MTFSQAKTCIKELDRSGLEDLIKSLGEEVIEAALKLGISPDNIEEAYAGQYKDDEDFAYEMADQTGAIDNIKEMSWPFTCIDWKYAARELMFDYCEQDGYYFRNL